MLDDKSGWIGPRDDLSLHGGCDIHKGIKYMANNWIPAPDAGSDGLESDYLAAEKKKDNEMEDGEDVFAYD